MHAFHNVDIDRWSYFEVVGLIKDQGYKDEVKLWERSSENSFHGCLKKLVLDNDALELANYALSKNCEVDVYVEHNVSIVDLGEKFGVNEKGEAVVGTGIERVEPCVDEGVDSDSLVENIYFSDSEEERLLATEDGFETSEIGVTESA